MSFWTAFGNRHNGTGIDDLLDKENVTVEQVLDHDDVIQECKYMNANLIEFLAQKSVVQDLIQYVVLPAPKSFEEKKTPDKYPYVASELFVCEIQNLFDILFDPSDNSLLLLLFSFLDQKPPLDPGSSAYFRKVVGVCMNRKPDELYAFMRANGIVEKMVSHIGLCSILELLCNLLWENKLPAAIQATSEWLFEENFIPLVISRLDPTFEHEPDVHANASRFLCELQKVQTISGSESNRLVSQSKNPISLGRLFRYLFSGSESCMAHILPVLTEMAEMAKNQSLDSRSVQDDMEWPLDAVLEELVKPLPQLLQCLSREEGAPLGHVRLQLLRLLLVLLQCESLVQRESEAISATQHFCTNNFFPVLLDLFFAYPNNNMLHGLVEKAILSVLESKSTQLHEALFVEAKLVQKLQDSYTVNAEWMESVRHNRLGYMGHVFRLIDNLSTRMRSPADDLVKKYIEEEKWTVFLGSECVRKEYDTREIQMGGRRPEPAFGDQFWEDSNKNAGLGYSMNDDDDSDEEENAGGFGGDSGRFDFTQNHWGQTGYGNDDSDSDEDQHWSGMQSNTGGGGLNFNNSSSDSDSDDDQRFSPFGTKTDHQDTTVTSVSSDSDSSDSGGEPTQGPRANWPPSAADLNLQPSIDIPQCNTHTPGADTFQAAFSSNSDSDSD
jgi:serine/threonine-protein phosphatase 6 regulatory subunit 3